MARKISSIPRGNDLWERHEVLYRAVFNKALDRLAQLDCEWGDEDQISERLCPILKTVCFEMGKGYNREVRTPDWEKPIQPFTEDDLKGGKVRNRPDFTCNMVDPHTDDPETYEISLHIECKRLGYASSSSWKLNENYVINGIKRFDSIAHEYGKRAVSGMMIGYMVCMEPMEIIQEVNGYLTAHLSTAPLLSFCFSQVVCDCEQLLARTNIHPSIFKLIHSWVDLRKANKRSSSSGDAEGCRS
jgi:hypothetical protein